MGGKIDVIEGGRKTISLVSVRLTTIYSDQRRIAYWKVLYGHIVQ